MNLIEQLLLDDRSITRGEKFLLVALSLREHATNTNLTLSHRAQTIILAERFERLASDADLGRGTTEIDRMISSKRPAVAAARQLGA